MAGYNLYGMKKQVFDVLLMPIECDKKVQGITVQDGFIRSGQKYFSSYADPDMSDFAVGFYEVLYGAYLDNGKMLDDSAFFANTDFAGDTMNSFQSIANVTPGAGKSAGERPPIQEWPQFLQDYFYRYRCLANFWVIPMKLGRQSMKFSRYDSLDLCLAALAFGYDACLADFPCYLSRLPDYLRFCKVHLLTERRDKDVIANLYRHNGGEQLVRFATEDIENRAYRIATSPFVEDLYRYFSTLCLV